MNRSRVTLDQWQALVAVVDAGGYAQAAEQLHRTQSTVSYAVRKLEEQLGIDVFELEGRRAALTDAGRVLYRRGKALLRESERVERSAAALAAGQEAELRLAVEIVFPTWLLLQCLQRFADERPETRIELYESVLGGTEELLGEGQVQLAICSRVPPGCVGDPLMHVRFVAVAAPSHPLHRLGRTLTYQDLREYRHLFVRDTATRRGTDKHGGITEQRWTVSHKATSIRAACMGLGFAWYAEDLIREELASDQLRPLPLSEGAERWATLYLATADPDTVGPGARRLVELIREAVATSATGDERIQQ
jgi:DNA-binding transcriptional LysR family regulator